jgi:pyoverdine/dityrosine biosynthesis protein Dit1
MQSANVSATIVSIFDKYRMMPTQIDEFASKGVEVFTNKINQFVNQKKQIEFVMLGFPFKSTNIRDKVSGVKPDLGEKLSIDTFKQFTSEIANVYQHGAVVRVMSDGLIFNDLLEVEDNTVHQYKDISMDLAKGVSFDIMDLNDFYTKGQLNSKREHLMNEFGITDVQLEERILTDPDVNYLYRGMIRFMREELAMKSFVSSNQHQVAAKRLARNMMFRNEAYSNLVKHLYKDSIRLSMHQSLNNGSKFSIDMIKGATHSAWHSVVCCDTNTDSITTMHKKDAIANGFIESITNELVYYVK